MWICFDFSPLIHVNGYDNCLVPGSYCPKEQEIAGILSSSADHVYLEAVKEQKWFIVGEHSVQPTDCLYTIL